MTRRVIAVVPALNAGRTVGAVVREIRRHLDVIVVDDGSTDSTAAAARGEGATVLRHAENRGKGAALKTGFAHALAAGYDGVITLDADGQHLPSDIPKLLEAAAAGAALVIGGRVHLFDQMRMRRRLANQFSAWAISFASRTQVTDSQSGFRYYSATLLRAIELRTDGFDMESEAVVRAGLGGFRVTVTPIGLGFVDGIATSHYRAVADTLRIAWTVFRARFLWRGGSRREDAEGIWQ